MIDIPTGDVTAVLVAGEWYEVVPGTFVVDDWEFDTVGGNPGNPDEDLAFSFTGQRSETISGRISELQALRY